MSRTAIKICGITRPQDAALAVELGAAAVGVVFARSTRQLDPAAAARVLAPVDAAAMRVGVFADQALDFVLRCVEYCRLDCVQLAGPYPESDLPRLPVPAIRVVPVRPGAAPDTRTAAAWILLDAPPLDGQQGGTGRSFDWRAAGALELPRARLIVAGGLRAENVGEAIARIRPAAVDVSSGVEAAPGIKDPDRLKAFVAAVATAAAAPPDPQPPHTPPIFTRL
jgi:phosphoribosylanthranilate isomerase